MVDAEEFDGGRRSILEVEKVHRRLRTIFEGVVDNSTDLVRGLSKEIKDAKKTLKNEPNTDKYVKLRRNVDKMKQGLAEIRKLLKGLKKNYRKNLQKFREAIPESTLTKNVNAGLGKKAGRTWSWRRYRPVALSIFLPKRISGNLSHNPDWVRIDCKAQL